ncbi:NAD(P)-dependent oxidoreductase [uncultured Litoreibacter sp.]|uniref:NAD-dependent epimerase/dehydratase family protein n=1 Tax=uncultured Litoreibacter sp. TaxID=1392394 RepID=UPI00260F1B0A|nr:NAD-dependent epimerase/dehydratase family protein [uncultured Litoreibacter sp.]
MNVLILGSGGRLGTLLQAAWPQDGQTNPTWYNRTALDVLRDRQGLEDACAGTNRIILLAGVTANARGKSFDDNIKLAEATLDAALGKPVFLSSTAAVYGALPSPLHESHAGAPVSDYGRSKQLMEEVASKHPNATCLRIGNVVGGDALLGVNRPHYTVHQFPSGEYVSRSYIGPSMLAHVLAALCIERNALPPILNLATSKAVAMNELLDAAGKSWSAEPAPASAMERVELDTTLLRSIVPIGAGQSTAEALVNDWQSVIGHQG